ncbi:MULTISPECIES: ABC transporter ATP-binding protein [unclassified Microbacterium]|uniref:ABC transporter ATP-binding protein n=1 Tax=unclassified Microbacterium TaxID=2609290 RepID=UPI00214AD8B5|nr:MULTISPECIES: ABC transporter ATP-binding protein [unclassified Microbacterium]MCR2800396.1 ABC transporter ATP-binding protein [Microbacterium sp. zg.Y818]MCR2826226.1 ABC transporter ATP-binding protein [Microbacterium sp. zg.Y909]WIM22356.1 ABC transporter ATP-binding protein [Microbacterium sp. zg-Y818]
MKLPTQQGGSETILRVEGLRVQFGAVNAVVDTSFELRKGEFLGVVGESGAGKSATAKAIVGLLAKNAKVSGRIEFDGHNLVEASRSHMRKVRGRRIGYIFQDALTALDPVYTVGYQLVEAYRAANPQATKAQARQRALEILEEVQIRDAKSRLDAYPHQLSGGMRQRVAIAVALIGDPDIIIADEPTSALDVTVQKRILELLQKVCRDRNAAVVLITHDLGVVAQTCDRVVVLYGGIVAEKAGIFDLFDEPRHPYTKALLDTLPKRGQKSALRPIPGQAVPVVGEARACPFANRCASATPVCHQQLPQAEQVGASIVRCFNPLPQRSLLAEEVLR